MRAVHARHRPGSRIVRIGADGIAEVLKFVGLPIPEDDMVARRLGEGLIRDINAISGAWALYLTPVQDGQVHIVGRVIEVKIAKAPRQYESKAVGQVRGTREILKTYLSGDTTRHAHMFRSKQLALLLKSRIEQTLVMDASAARDFEGIDLNQLSAALASGKYHVDYCIGSGGRNLLGDVFLLHTTESQDLPGKATIRENEDVRVIELTQSTLHWLAFQPEDTLTLAGPPTDTLPPHLGSQDNDSPVMRYSVSGAD